MADGRGGYRKPTKPAVVSGPGKFAARTDGGVNQPIRDMTGGAYGDNAELSSLQGSAPMNASGRSQQGGGPQQVPTQGPPTPTPFDAPSERPGEPVTAGNPMGPGVGPASLGMGLSAARLSATLRQIAVGNDDGSLDDLIVAMEDAGL